MTKCLFCCREIDHSLQQEIDISLKLSRQPCRAISVASSSGGAMVVFAVFGELLSGLVFPDRAGYQRVFEILS
jgi:hypothetical protein